MAMVVKDDTTKFPKFIKVDIYSPLNGWIKNISSDLIHGAEKT